jgi:hypothetical protein
MRRDMMSYGFDMWGRAAREISSAYEQAGSPLRLLAALEPPVPTLHLYAGPPDPGYLAAQQSFAETHPWFSVGKLEAGGQFPLLEMPAEVAAAVEHFVQSIPGTGPISA